MKDEQELDWAKTLGNGISGIGRGSRKVRDCLENNPELGMMGTKDGEEAGEDGAEGHTEAGALRAEAAQQILQR